VAGAVAPATRWRLSPLATVSAVSDNALYWYFMTGVWTPLAAIAFLTPYVAGR